METNGYRATAVSGARGTEWALRIVVRTMVAPYHGHRVGSRAAAARALPPIVGFPRAPGSRWKGGTTASPARALAGLLV